MPVTGEINHPRLGRVIIIRRPNNRRATARWRNGAVYLNVPLHTTPSDIIRLLDGFADRLLAVRPNLIYTIPSQLSFPGIDILLRPQSVAPDRILAKAALPTSTVEVGSRLNPDDPATVKAISNTLCAIARRVAPDILIPRARQLADSIGRHPSAWTISRGYRTLGSCSSAGIISLSHVLVFLTQPLRDYVICHELAHLSEMNHSPRFHALLNRYLGGHEAALTSQLRHYSWPILRK
ncbi:MAG: M48 family metallopeptidase [Muribaculaceae bacterium]|nr:M48 family metallopeptidase [Muribaculaceae bacterium]